MKRSGMLLKVLSAALTIFVCSDMFAADGIWTNTVSGNWSNAGNWQDGTVAGDGESATFKVTAGNIAVTNDLGLISLSRITANPDGGQSAIWNIAGGTNELVSPALVNVVAGELSFNQTTLF